MAHLTPAVLRALEILELFVQRPALTAPEVIRSTGFPRASVHELLATLVARDWLRRDEDGTFRLGVQPYVVGSAYAARLDLRQVGLRIAESVAQECAETVNVGIREGCDVIYLVIVDSTQPVRLASQAGRLPAWATAIGKALLLDLEDRELRQLLPSELPPITSATIATRAALERELARFRAEGVCYESGESTPGVSCVGAPIRGADGSIVAAMSVAVPAERWSNRTPEQWASLVLRGAAQMSNELGFRPPVIHSRASSPDY